MPILRIWRTRVDERRLAEYDRFARDKSQSMFHRQDGFLAVLFARTGPDAVVVTLWQDEAALARLGTSSSYADTVDEIAGSGLLVGDASVEVFELHGASPTATAFARALRSL